MVKTLEGTLEGAGLKFAVVVSRFNDFLNAKLLDGALDCLRRHGVKEGDITVARVPGAFEIPFAARKMAASKKYHAVILLGAIVRGATSHYQYISAEVVKGAAQVMLDTGVPVALGVITVETLEQGIERAGTKSGNKGWDAAMAAIEMARLNETL